MNFTVEVLLKGREDVVEQSLQHDAAPEAWTDEDVPRAAAPGARRI